MMMFPQADIIKHIGSDTAIGGKGRTLSACSRGAHRLCTMGRSCGVSGCTGCTQSRLFTSGSMRCSWHSSAALVAASALSAASDTSIASSATFTGTR